MRRFFGLTTGIVLCLAGYGCKQVMGWQEATLWEPDAGESGGGGNGGGGGKGGGGGSGSGGAGGGGCVTEADCPSAGPNQKATCDAGVCGFACDSGYADCDTAVPGCEVNVVDNRDHCGSCDVQCAAYCSGTTCNDPVYVGRGYQHTCAILKDGSVWCWGRNENGELGDGSKVSKTVPTKVALPGPAVQVVGGGDSFANGQYTARTCARLADRTVSCWGTGSDVPATTTPKPLSLSNIAHMDVGRNHMCAVDLVGTLFCWGNNVSGQLGTGNTTSTIIPTKIATGFKRVATGDYDTCAIKTDASLQCWGLNDHGQLGIGSQADQYLPVNVPGLSALQDVQCGSGYACASNGLGAYCWGSNTFGMLGIGSQLDASTPQVVDLLPPEAIETGNYQTGALVGGDVFMWGYNAQGQLGNGTTNIASKPQNIGLQNAAMLALSAKSSCALLKSGKVLCWGDNAYGELGTGTTKNSSLPVSVVWP